MYVTAIIAAGGRGHRLGASVPKQLLIVGGRSILERSVSLFLEHSQIDELVVALPADLISDPPAYLRHTSKPVRVVEGGRRRQDSVANAFEAIDRKADVIVIHDAARPFASHDLISRTIAAASEGGAALAALRASDTVKRATEDGSRHHLVVGETLPRESIFLAQTPQAFTRSVLQAALALGRADVDATDEASLAERAGHQVRIVEGEASNVKITTPSDLIGADFLAGRVNPSPDREGSGLQAAVVTVTHVGTGYDLHRLVPDKILTIGGIVIPSDRGPLAHSDGDVVCHAVTDAILGAAGLGDIGRYFPDTDDRWKGASSIDLLARAAGVVAEGGFSVVNVDATVILERPKIKDHVEAMRMALAGAIGIDRASVSVKGKTNEGVDAVGRGEAIAAHAVALIAFKP